MLRFLNSSLFYGGLLGLLIPLRAPWQLFAWVLSGGILVHALLELFLRRRRLDTYLREKSAVIDERIGLDPIPLSRKIAFALFGSGFWISSACLLVWGVKWLIGFDIWTDKSLSGYDY